MARDGSGVYSKPAGTTFAPNTTIESAKMNALTDDIAADLNTARPITAGGTGATSAAQALVNLGADGKMTLSSKSAGYTAVAADNNSVIRCTAALTLALTPAATLGSGWHCWVIADGGDVIIDPNAAETVDGSATLTLPNGYTCILICDGSGFRTDKMAATIASAITTAASSSKVSVNGSSRNLFLSADGLSAPITISADEITLEDGSNNYKTRRNVSLSVSMASTGANGLDTGTVASSTWYSVWVIYNSNTDTTAGLACAVGSLTGTHTSGSAVITGISSTTNLAAGMQVGGANIRPGSVIKSVDSSTQITMTRTATATGSASFSFVANPTMPSGYTYKARVGMVYTESGVNKYPFPFVQVGRRVRWVPTPASNLVNPRQMSAITSTTATVSTAAYAPVTALVVTVLLQPPLGSNNSFVHPNANSGGTASTTYPPQISQGTTSTYITQMGDLFLEAQSVFLSIGSGTGELFSIGYEDNI